MIRSQRRWILGISLGVIALAGALVVLAIWRTSWSPRPDPITRLGGTVQTEQVYRHRINEFLDRVWPGFSPGRDGFAREVVVEVNLNGTRADNDTLEYVRRFETLQRLHLDGTQIDDDGLASIAGLPHLNMLSLDQTAVTDAGLAHLPTHPQLQVLFLSQTAVGDAGLKQIARMPALGYLHLMETDISDAGLRSLQHLSTLQGLQLGGNPRVTHAGIRELVGALKGVKVDAYEEESDGGYTVCRHFNSQNGDQPDGVVRYVIWQDATDAELAKLTGYPELTALHLAGAPVTDAGLEQLHQLPQLRWLNVNGTQVTPTGIERLRQANQELEIARE